MTAYNVNEIDFLDNQESLAADIVNRFKDWNNLRQTWKEEKKELREYIVATDTTKTSNSALPWKNKTTLPKLTQIRDNLHANYMAALFPNDNWLTWVGEDVGDSTAEKRAAIEAYSKNKLNKPAFKNTISQLVLDYIDYGNAFAQVIFVNKFKKDPDTGEEIPIDVGPKLIRISPFDVVFNPTAHSFDDTPKIIRHLKSIGELKRDIEVNPDLNYDPAKVDKIIEDRDTFHKLAEPEVEKSVGYVADGFANFSDYFNSGYVELLELWGDIYDVVNDVFYEDRVITIADGKYVLRNEPNKSWIGEAPIKHIGWRVRSDNLWAMGPLDNLVGMQYRIDHLENLKADIMDMIVHPTIKIIGDVEGDIKWGPGAKWFVGEDGDVQIMHPDTTALQADFQIQVLEQKMEELAGAPKEAMGFRTPGEKTKYEVQVLERGAGRIFQAKTAQFESIFVEPLINSMFELARRNITGSEVIRVFKEETGITNFLKISKEDIKATGRLIPMGARHFAEDAKFIQEATSFLSTVGQDPGVRPHLSGKELAKRMSKRMGLSSIFKENVHLEEQMETEMLMQQMRSQLEDQAAQEVEPMPEDFIDNG